MKKYDLIYYWQNYLDNHESIDFKPTGYVLKFSLINSFSRDVFNNWYSFNCSEELLGFIKYVIIPSIYITKAFGKEENTIFLDALDKYETIELIEEACNINSQLILEDLKKEYDLIDSISEKIDIKKLKVYFNIVNSKENLISGIFSKIELFDNVTCIGKELVREFEEDNMLDELESHMSLDKNQILAMFDGIDKNPFMLKRLGTFLSNTLVF